jgi:hypothetical protein
MARQALAALQMPNQTLSALEQVCDQSTVTTVAD